MYFFSEFKKSLNGKSVSELMAWGLECEHALQLCKQKQETGQGDEQVKCCGINLNIWVSAQGTTQIGWVNRGTIQKLKRMRAIILTRISEKQRLR